MTRSLASRKREHWGSMLTLRSRFFTNSRSFYEAVASERVVSSTVSLDMATKIVAVGSIMNEAMKQILVVMLIVSAISSIRLRSQAYRHCLERYRLGL